MLEDLYAYLGIIGWLFITAIGLPPIPEEVAVFGVGIWAQQRQLNLLLAWLCCIVGILGTDLFLYGVGRTGGKWLLSRPFVKKLISDERREKIIDGFHTHGVKFLVTGRLLPGIRTAIFVVAGAIHYPVPRFMLADLASIPVISLFFFGSVFAAKWIEWLIDNIHSAQNIVLLGLILAVALFAAWRYFSFIRRRAITNNFEAPHIPVLEQILPDTHVGSAPPAPEPAENASPPSPPPARTGMPSPVPAGAALSASPPIGEDRPATPPGATH